MEEECRLGLYDSCLLWRIYFKLCFFLPQVYIEFMPYRRSSPFYLSSTTMSWDCTFGQILNIVDLPGTIPLKSAHCLQQLAIANSSSARDRFAWPLTPSMLRSFLSDVSLQRPFICCHNSMSSYVQFPVVTIPNHNRKYRNQCEYPSFPTSTGSLEVPLPQIRRAPTHLMSLWCGCYLHLVGQKHGLEWLQNHTATIR